MTDSIQTIRRSAQRFFSGTLLSRIAGMLRDMSMAYAFGTEASVAAFMIAFRFSHLLRRLFGEGGLQSAFIPEFESLRHENEERAYQFFKDLIVSLSFFLALLISMGCLVLGLIIHYVPLHSDNLEILWLTFLMLPSLLFICLYGLNAAFLQCQKIFFIPSVAPVAFNLLWIITVLLFKNLPTEQAMPYLSVGVIIACLSQWLITLPSTWALFKARSSSFFKIHLFSPDVLRLGKPLFLGLIGISASQVNNALDAIFARYAESEGPAFLWYAMRLQQLPVALFGVAIAGALLPPLSRAIKTNDQSAYNHFLEEAFRQTFTLILPMVGAMYLLGDSSITLLFGHGDFNTASIIGTTRCLWAYAFGLLPTTLVLILVPAFYAKSNYRLPAYASILSMLMNVGLNTLMIVGWGFGAMSVALATSFSAWVNLFYLGGVLFMKKHLSFSKSLFIHLLNISSSTLIACLLTAACRIFWKEDAFISIYLEKATHFPTHFISQFTSFFWQTSCFFSSFVISYVCFLRLTRKLTIWVN